MFAVSLSKAFSTSVKMIMCFLIQFVNMVYHIDWLVYIEESLHPWNKFNLIIVYEKNNWSFVSNSVWKTLNFWFSVAESVVKILSRIFHLCSSVILACSFLFCYCCLFLVLVSGWWWPCRMSLEVFLPLQFFEGVLEAYALALLWIFDRILLWNYLVLGLCFLGDFWSQLRFQCL